MDELINHQVRLSARPVGAPTHEDFAFTEEPVGDPEDGQVLVGVSHISLDPAMRGWMDDTPFTYSVGLGEVMRAWAAGTVLVSRHPAVAAEDHVTGSFRVQEYAIAAGAGVQKVDTSLAPLPVFLGILGMPGLTAYFGVLDVGQLHEGDTVVVSSAAGAVGSVAGQIAKLKGCRVVGIAGGDRKCRYIVDELGFDVAIDYKSQDVGTALSDACPKGIDVYFDNVGGEILDAALARLARGARVVICGAISQYNATPPWRGPANYMSLLVNRATMRGFIRSDFEARYGEALEEMTAWYREGKLTSRVDVSRGLENFPEAFGRLFSGDNFGKLVLEIGDA